MNTKMQTSLGKFLTKKIAKNKKEISGIAGLTFGDLIYDVVRVDQSYIDGVNFSRPSKDLSSIFKIGKQNISESSDKLNILHERNYSGYTHEFVTDQWARTRGEEVIIPEKFNQPGYDRIYNGEKFQIKFDSLDGIREHRSKYPDIKVRTDIETAEAYKERFPEDVEMVFGTVPKSLTENYVLEGKEATMEVFQNEELFETGLPETFGIAAIIPAIKNFSYLVDEKLNLAQAAKNITGDTLAYGLGMSWGAAIGAAIDPFTTAIGAVGGAYYTKKVWDWAKVSLFCSDEEAQLQDDIISYVKALRKKLFQNQKTLEKKANKWKSTFGSAVYRKKVLRETKITKELYQYIINRMRNEYKDKNQTLKFLDKIIKMNKSNKFDFDDIIDKVLTPKEEKEYSGSKLPSIATKFRIKGMNVGISHKFLEKETKQLVNSIENFVKAIQKYGV